MRQTSDREKVRTIIVKVDKELEDLIPGFLENRRKDIEKVMSALDRGDYETIWVLGHSMKGSGGGYGFDAISRFGKDLEEAAKERDEEKIRELSGNLLTYVSEVEVVYE